MAKIKSVQFSAPSKNFFDDNFGRSTVTAVMDDGSEQELFTFYIDEVSFASGELTGRTAEEAKQLYTRKLADYIRS